MGLVRGTPKVKLVRGGKNQSVGLSNFFFFMIFFFLKDRKYKIK